MSTINSFAATYSQQNTVLCCAISVIIASFATEQRSKKSPFMQCTCSRATPEVQGVKVLHEETVADFNSRFLIIIIITIRLVDKNEGRGVGGLIDLGLIFMHF